MATGELLGIWKKIYGILTPLERRRGLGLILLMVANATVETAGVASILPFLGVLGNPEIVETNRFLRAGYDRFGFQSVDRYLILLAVLSAVLVLGSAVVRVVTEYGMIRFSEMRRHSLGYRLLRGYLREPYPFFLRRNSAHLSKSILSEVDHVVASVFLPALKIPAYGFVVVSLTVLVVLVDAKVAAVMATTLGVSYGLLYYLVIGMIRRRGVDRLEANRERFATAAEVFGGIKDVKLLGREDAYLRRFSGPSLRFSHHQAVIRTVSTVPRFLIEAIGFGAVLVLAVSLVAVGDSLGRVLPVLGLYAFAGYRMLPAVQNLYANVANLQFGVAAIDSVYADMVRLPSEGLLERNREGRVELKESIALANVSFQYEGAGDLALAGVSLDIPAGSLVGFVGETGAGKSTAVDLVLGLLVPTEGEVRIDGLPLQGTRVRSWQDSIGYVPQQIYLADDTVAANIAFGEDRADIEMAAVERAARLSQIHEVIVDRMPEGYETVIGERGVRLSGGQRQRLGIARALYRNPTVLVFDEATSAVDTLTENEVMGALRSLVPDKTIILVAHRLSTVRDADRIFLLERGRLCDAGTYSELVERSPRFRRMTAAIGG